MHTTLYLTAAEQKMFDALPADRRDGWKLQNVTLVMEDDKAIAVRAHMAHFDNPGMEKAAKALETAETQQDFDAISKMVRFDTFTPEQIAELFFVLGVKTMTGFIGYLLLSAKNDEDIEGVAYISELRRLLSETNSEPTV
jgi:hypothetical protein